MPIQFNSSLSSTGPFTAPSFTGSLFGTASHVKVTGSGVTVNWSGDLLQLTASAQNSSQVFVSESSPGLQPSGSLWWNSIDGNLYVQTEGPTGTAFVAATNTIVGAAGNAISASHALFANNSINAITAVNANTASYFFTSSVTNASYVPLIAGPGISIDGMKISASVISVNGAFPDPNGNVTTALTEAITGPSSSLVVSSSGDVTGSLTEGTVWVISGEVSPNEALNGVSYIYDIDNGAGEWLKLSSLDQTTADNRYLMLTPQAPLAGPLETTWGVTGSLLGTATNALTASLATSAIIAESASVSLFSVTASHAVSARTAVTASHAVTASYVALAPGSQVLFNTTGSWTIPVGSSVQSFTVATGATYTMWLYANIPNGIITWNATATVSNANVPSCGVQYCWVYTGGGTLLDITSIPDQIVGTSGSILRSEGAVTQPTNVFRFGINNNSGAPQTVYYGYTKQ